MNTGKIEVLAKALRISHLPLALKKYTRHGVSRWAAFVPKRINSDGSIAELSDVKLCEWCATNRDLRETLAKRYLGEAYDCVAFINTRWAMKMPNWAGKFGGLPELANAMKRAGLIA